MVVLNSFECVLARYELRAKEEIALMQQLPPHAGMARRDEFLIPIGPAVGRFLSDLVIASRAKTIVELGTSYGYSTLWLAQAAKQCGATVISIDCDGGKQQYAASQLLEAGLESYVVFKQGDALTELEVLDRRPDVVLIDLWKELYVPCFEVLDNNISAGTWLIADNMISPDIHAEDAAHYRQVVDKTERYNSMLLPLGSGIYVSQKR